MQQNFNLAIFLQININIYNIFCKNSLLTLHGGHDKIKISLGDYLYVNIK